MLSDKELSDKERLCKNLSDEEYNLKRILYSFYSFLFSRQFVLNISSFYTLQFIFNKYYFRYHQNANLTHSTTISTASLFPIW